jgi:hypothetical protein
MSKRERRERNNERKKERDIKETKIKKPKDN